VPRTWTDEGWMYTAEQLNAAVNIADNLRRDRDAQHDTGPATQQR
jgi:hypothetical protein